LRGSSARRGSDSAAGTGAEVTIRDLETLEEMRACVALQELTWGRDFTEKVPLSILKVGRRLGGVSVGAFLPDHRLVGFVFGLTGLTPEGLAHWSDMLAVTPDYRRRGLGVRLKLFQRERVLSLGVRTMFWTFDPLEVGNARLNFRRLGGVADEYVPDMYGPSVSPLHLGLATDRLVVRWDLDSRRVEETLARSSGDGDDPEVKAAVMAFEVKQDGEWPEPEDEIRPWPRQGGYLIPVPDSIRDLHVDRPDLARRWRQSCRAALANALDGSGRLVDVLSGPGFSQYLVLPRDSAEEDR
jgi:predicted GNAT superfamily acetyltransferase